MFKFHFIIIFLYIFINNAFVISSNELIKPKIELYTQTHAHSQSTKLYFSKSNDKYHNDIIFINHVKNSYKMKSSIFQLRGGMLNDFYVTALVLGESILWLKIWTTLAKKNILDSKLTRKIIHSGSAPLFMAHWPLYSDMNTARLLASMIPLLQVVRLYLAGTSKNISLPTTSISNNASSEVSAPSELIQAVSRSGNSAEALGGPLLYSIILLLGTFLFFRESPVGIVAISQMAAGDGFADIIGRRYGTIKWPFMPNKSIAGSVAFVLAGFLVSTGLLTLMSYTGVQSINMLEKVPLLLGISILSAVVELIPGVDDNLSVPIIAGLATYLLF